MQEVAVIIPNFNGMAYLDGVLAGLECQTVSNFDVILVDNGSNDGSCAFVATRYPWVHLIELPENFGDRLSSAMSRGWHSFVNGMEDFAVALAYSWMWLILWAVIIAAAVVILRKLRRRSGMKKPLFKKKNDVKPDDKSGDT